MVDWEGTKETLSWICGQSKATWREGDRKSNALPGKRQGHGWRGLQAEVLDDESKIVARLLAIFSLIGVESYAEIY